MELVLRTLLTSWPTLASSSAIRRRLHAPPRRWLRRTLKWCTVCWVQIRTVILSERAVRDLRGVPRYIQGKLLIWIDAVELRGLAEVRKVPGFHDEPLKGDRKGQRSIRLNQAYRAIYVVVSGAAEFVRVEEINKHRY
jgi:proteic killer suppression protein